MGFPWGFQENLIKLFGTYTVVCYNGNLEGMILHAPGIGFRHDTSKYWPYCFAVLVLQHLTTLNCHPYLRGFRTKSDYRVKQWL